jgi:hypothetical protein
MALAIAAFAMACADSATAPRRALLPDGIALAISTTVIDFQGGGSYPTGVADGYVVLCKTGDAAGTFSFSVAVTGGATTNVTRTLGAGGGTDCGTGPAFTSAVSGNGAPDQVVITEATQANWAVTGVDIVQFLARGIFGPDPGPGGYTAPRLDDAFSVANRQATVYVNGDMARRVTFTNHFTPPPVTGCTYTKGWYQNKNGAPTVTAVDNRTKSEAQTILASTPSPLPKQNLGVTWGTDNLLHNLYQQLLAALLNLGGNGHEHDGPQAVDNAIDAALAGTGGTGLNITTTLTHDEMSALVDVLSAFNEGTFQGWPHCSD